MKEQFHSFSWLWKIRYYVHSSFIPTFYSLQVPKCQRQERLIEVQRIETVLSGLLIQLKIPERVLH